MATWQTRPTVNRMPPGINNPVALRFVMEKYNQWKNSPNGIMKRVAQNVPNNVPVLIASLRKKNR
ncbi:hypothetical protein D1872_307590 [compost metagenome]